MPITTRTSTPWGELRRPVLPNPDDPLGLFGDGPPHWTINAGKLGERALPSAVGSSTFGLCSNTAANRLPVGQADPPTFNRVPWSRSRF